MMSILNGVWRFDKTLGHDEGLCRIPRCSVGATHRFTMSKETRRGRLQHYHRALCTLHAVEFAKRQGLPIFGKAAGPGTLDPITGKITFETPEPPADSHVVSVRA